MKTGMGPVDVVFHALGVALLGAALWGALSYPLMPLLSAGLLMIYGAVVVAWPVVGIAVVPIALPLLDLTPYSGWQLLTEFDLVVAITLGALWLGGAGPHRARGIDRIGGLIMVAFGLVVMIGAAAALTPYRAVEPTDLASYLSPFNTLRVAKGFVAGALLWLTFSAMRERQGEGVYRALLLGASVGLLGTGLVALWERGVFGALLSDGAEGAISAFFNFGSSYRITGLFSGMHTGGTSIDGYLVLVLPLAAAGLARSRLGPTQALHGLALIAGLYAVMATYTRATLVAAGLALALFAALFVLRELAGRGVTRLRMAVLLVAFLGVSFSLLQVRSFGGFQGLAGAMFVVWLAAWVGFYWGSKIPLVALAVGAVGALAGGYQVFDDLMENRWAALSLGGAIVFALVSTLLLAGLTGAGVRAVRPVISLPILVGGLVVISLSWLAVLPGLGGFRISERLTESGADWDYRTDHWQRALSLAEGNAWFGLGPGSYPHAHFWDSVGSGKSPATFRFVSEGLRSQLELGSGGFILLQRVDLTPGTPVTLRLSLRAPENGAGQVRAQLCPWHILDLEGRSCPGETVRLDKGGGWKTYEVIFKTSHLAPSVLVGWPSTFSLSSWSREPVGVRSVQLISSTGRDVIANGNFSAGPERWFLVSNYRHLAWHVKHLYLHWRIEHGWVGLLLAVALVVLGHRRALGGGTTIGLGIAAALTGFLLLGFFASPVDDPRIALLFFFLLGLSLLRQGDGDEPLTPGNHRKRRKRRAGRLGSGIEMDAPVAGRRSGSGQSPDA